LIVPLDLFSQIAKTLSAKARSFAGSLGQILRLGLVLNLSLSALLWTGGLLAGADPALATGPDGAALFEAHCAGCHIHGGNIIRRGRTLKLKALEQQGITSPAAIATIANQGIGQMGGYGQVLGTGGAEQVGLYVWQQALAGWAPLPSPALQPKNSVPAS
jgi:cytochrome c6